MYTVSLRNEKSLSYCKGLDLSDLRKRYRSERIAGVGGGLQFTRFLESEDLNYQTKRPLIADSTFVLHDHNVTLLQV